MIESYGKTVYDVINQPTERTNHMKKLAKIIGALFAVLIIFAMASGSSVQEDEPIGAAAVDLSTVPDDIHFTIYETWLEYIAENDPDMVNPALTIAAVYAPLDIGDRTPVAHDDLPEFMKVWNRHERDQATFYSVELGDQTAWIQVEAGQFDVIHCETELAREAFSEFNPDEALCPLLPMVP